MTTNRTDVDNLAELRRRKAALKERLEMERSELQATVKELRENLTPATIARQVVGSFFQGDQPAGEGKKGLAGVNWQGPLRLATSLLVRDPRASFLLYNVTPFVLRTAPKIWRKASDALPTREKVFGNLRLRVRRLRARFREIQDESTWFV
ncbi:MAG: hypothetical protein ABIQ93_14455 [Saprospiraceae bacterium]